MAEETSKITIIADLLKRDPVYKEVIDQLEERLYNRYMVYLADKPRFNAKTQAIPKQYLVQILSFKNTLELNKVAKKYNLSQDQRDIIPAVLWKIFWREAEIKNLPQMLNSELGLNNIRVAYQMALDIVPIYMPISDYLGDLGMMMKRWQYETPSGEFPISKSQFPINPPSAEMLAQPATQTTPSAAAQPTTAVPAVRPVRPATPAISVPERSVAESKDHDKETLRQAQGITIEKDESIARVQETMARISGQMAKIQAPAVIPSSPSVIPAETGIQPKSDIEPEYLPDTPPTHSANIINLKNF